MKRAQWVIVGLAALFLVLFTPLPAGAQAASFCMNGPGRTCTLGTLIVSTIRATLISSTTVDAGTANVNALTVNGDAGIAGNASISGTLLGNVVDAGTVQAQALGVAGQSALAGVTATTIKADVVDGGTVLGQVLVAYRPLGLQSTDSTGSPGAATINKASGRSAVANGEQSVTVTNSQVLATSNVQITPMSEHATECVGWYVDLVANGSFRVKCPAAATTAAWHFAWVAFDAL